MGQVTAQQQAQTAAVAQVLAVVAQLRNPQGGCPWDLAQTHASLRPHLLEEAHEAVEAMGTLDTPANPQHLKEELGDVLLQVLLHAQLAQEAGQFSFADVCDTLATKLVSRHPHVFAGPSAQQGEGAINTPEAVSAQWQQLKAQERTAQANQTQQAVFTSQLEGTASQALPTLQQAAKISRKAVKLGFAWPTPEALWACVQSELDELKEATETQPANPAHVEEELGDLLFACASVAQQVGADPNVALIAALAKFKRRFEHMERAVAAQAGQPKAPEAHLKALSFEAWEALWQQAKQATNSAS
jgi:MazG family protein